MKRFLRFPLTCSAFLACASFVQAEDLEFENLFDASLSKWEKFIGIPHSSVVVEGYESSDDVKKGTPIGKNDPLNVFTAIKEDGEDLVAVSGQIYGGLTTLKEYENYHFSIEVKWGEKKWEPRLELQRDAGLLYHCVGEHGAFWHVWMQCLEAQIQEKDMGDLFFLAGTGAKFKAEKIEEKWHKYDPLGEVVDSRKEKAWSVKRSENFEKSHGEWNVIEIYVLGDKAIHLTNGNKVMELFDATCKLNGKIQPLVKGKIQLQSEGAEMWYRRAKIRQITEFPTEFRGK